MNNTENVYQKSFVKAIISAVCLVFGTLMTYSFYNEATPNLILLGLASFGSFNLIFLLGYKIKQRFIDTSNT